MNGYDRVVSISPLVVERVEGDEVVALEVPLAELDEVGLGIRLFDGGVIWEDEHATISFRLETTARVRKATVSVNGHTELWTRRYDDIPLTYGDEVAWRYEFVVDEESESVQYRLPFALTCGFARVAVCIVFEDGLETTYLSQDIICLDEPRPGGDGQSGDKAEESNVRDMYRILMRADGNQASEWMFAPSQPGGQLLAADDDTDWSHASLARTLRTASETLDLVYDGLDDEDDQFPNEMDVLAAASRFDTPENREVRALLVSLASSMHEMAHGLQSSVDELDHLQRHMHDLVAKEGVRRRRAQSLPALALVEVQLDQERGWLLQALDMAERADAAIEDFDEFVGGAHAVSEIPFRLPAKEGLYLLDVRYEQLFNAMETWERARRVDGHHREIQIHAVKPDRLFEYFALNRLLTALFDMGFRENASAERPIDRFDYRLAKENSQFRNEWRCANTYRLRRESGEGGSQEVDLYYQPVVYAYGACENGISLRRVGEDAHRSSFWTPDYLLVVRDEGVERMYAIDAKYSYWSTLVGEHGRLADCVDKYLLRTRVVDEVRAQRPIDGVWILSGRLDGKRVFTRAAGRMLSAGEETMLWDEVCGIVPWNRNTGRRKRAAFFQKLGLC